MEKGVLAKSIGKSLPTTHPVPKVQVFDLLQKIL
jgi:hypothetical protein